MNLRRPITPATTGPLSIPILTASEWPTSPLWRMTSSRMSRAISATASAWSGRGVGRPPATM